jgi:hypothetical protein
MHRLILLLLFTTQVLAASPKAPAVEIVSATFGIFDVRNPKKVRFEHTLLIPHQEGQRYGWIITVRTKQRSLSVREEYIIPTAATEAGPTGNLAEQGTLTIPLPRRNQVSQRQLVPVRGQIYGEWAIGPGEPPGKRHLQVIVEGQVAGSFEYEVK